MSLDALNWAFKLKVAPAGKKLVLIALANWADEKGVTWPAHTTLATITGQVKSTVRKYLVELEAEGLITRTSRYQEKGQQISNQYLLSVGGCRVTAGGVPGVGTGGVPRDGTNTLRPSDTFTDTVASPEIDILPPAKTAKGSAPSNLSILKERTLEVYSQVRADNWIDHKKPPKDAEPQLREALAYSDGDVEAAVAVVRDALTYAAGDSWWTDPTKSLSMANILAKGRVTTFAEKQRALTQGDAKATMGLYDLTTGNPLVKVQEISKRVSHTRDASEEEWHWADDDSKGRFIRPGRAYRVDHQGNPAEPEYRGMAEVMSVEQIYVYLSTPEGRKLRTHVSNLGRESYDRGAGAEDGVVGRDDTDNGRGLPAGAGKGGGAGGGAASDDAAAGASASELPEPGDSVQLRPDKPDTTQPVQPRQRADVERNNGRSGGPGGTLPRPGDFLPGRGKAPEGGGD